MSEYKKKANLKDSIISGVVVLLILIGAVVLLVNQFSEVDLTKKELEELRAEVKLAKVDLLEKQDKWDLKVIRDTKYISEQEEEFNLALKEFEREKAQYNQEIEELREKYNQRYRGPSRKEIEAEIRAEYKSKESSKASNELELLALKEKNATLEKEIAAYKKANSDKKPKSTTTKEKANVASTDQTKVKQEIAKMMDEFAALDVDLKKPNWCDKDYSVRFMKADKQFKDIKALIEKNGMTDTYKVYLTNASRNKSESAPDGWCNGVKMM
ncbi:hypothetical protein N8878_04350 [Psychromonas sp.]|nr:hypothetical protein [Psychromonas sp.]